MQARILRAPGLSYGLLQAIIKLSLNHGSNVHSCLKNTGIPEEKFNIKEWNVTLDQEIQLIRNLLMNVSGHPVNLGLEIGFSGNLNIYGMIGQSALSSANVRQALDIISRYTFKAIHPVRIHLADLGSCTKICYDLNIEIEKSVAQFLLAREIGMSLAVYRMVNKSTDQHILEIGLECSGSEISGVLSGALQQCLKYPEACSVKEHAGSNYLLVDQQALQLRMLFADEDLGQLIEKHCYERMYQNNQFNNTELQRPSLQARIFTILKHSESVDRDQVARKLNMSTRSLSRRLNEEGTSWRALFAQYRIEHACQLLRNTDLTLYRIAERAGYSSASALSNAFKRYKGRSPNSFRSKM